MISEEEKIEMMSLARGFWESPWGKEAIRKSRLKEDKISHDENADNAEEPDKA